MTVIGQASVSIGGLSLANTEASGVQWSCDPVVGWGSPSSTIEVTQRPTAHGATVNKGWLTSRVISVTGWVSAPTRALLVDALNRLRAAVSLDMTTLTVNEWGTVRSARVYRQDAVLVGLETAQASSWSIQVVAPDPRLYGTPISQPTSMGTTSGGLTWPITWPLVWTGVSTSGTIHIDNPGSIASPVFLRIDGPIAGPIITHIGASGQDVFALSLTVAAGDFVTVDMEKQQVLANGQASRDGYVTSPGFFALDPGPNDISFQASGGYSAGALLTVTTTPAWP